MNALMEFNSIVPHLKGIALIASLIFAGLSLYYVLKTGFLVKRMQDIVDAFAGSFRFRKKTLKAWKEISSHLQTEDAREWKIAIIEADILLGETLNILGVSGKTTGEKLKNLDRSAISNINDVWEAHKLRNQIAHESSISLDRETANSALGAYKQAFQDLGLLS